MSVEERVGTALSRGTGLDKVLAAGLVGIEESMTDSLLRLKIANDPKAYFEALKGVVKLARALNAQKNWRAHKQLGRMSKKVLDYWLADICPACTGKRDDVEGMGPTALQETGTPFLEGVPCAACNGTGKRPYPWLSGNRHDKVERYHSDLLREIHRAEARIKRGLQERLYAEAA